MSFINISKTENRYSGCKLKWYGLGVGMKEWMNK